MGNRSVKIAQRAFNKYIFKYQASLASECDIDLHFPRLMLSTGGMLTNNLGHIHTHKMSCPTDGDLTGASYIEINKHWLSIFFNPTDLFFGGGLAQLAVCGQDIQSQGVWGEDWDPGPGRGCSLVSPPSKRLYFWLCLFTWLSPQPTAELTK